MINVLDWYNPWLLALMVNGFLAAIAVAVPKKLLTPWGYVHGVFLGICIWGTLGWRGYAIVLAYFLLGSGNDSVGAALGDNIVVLGEGRDTVTAGSGNDSVIAYADGGTASSDTLGACTNGCLLDVHR